MTGKKSFLGALLLSALAVCAFGVANASAMTMHECKEFKTINEGTKVQYKDAKCSEENKEGKFETIPITENVEVETEATLTPTTAGNRITKPAGGNEETAGTHAVLHSILGGVEIQITCTSLSSPGAKAKNVKVGEVMSVTGSGKTVYTGCTIVSSPKVKENCQVPETLETVPLTQTTSGMEVVIKPSEGTRFITIPITPKTGKTCPAAVAGEKKVEGVARGKIVAPTALEFVSEEGVKSELTFGGQEAFFTAVVHSRTKGTTGEEGTIALETNATTDNK